MNEELEKKVEFLTNEKERLEECVQTLTVEMGTMKHKIDNMENHTETIKQEMEQVSVTTVHVSCSTRIAIDCPNGLCDCL